MTSARPKAPTVGPVPRSWTSTPNGRGPCPRRKCRMAFGRRVRRSLAAVRGPTAAACHGEVRACGTPDPAAGHGRSSPAHTVAQTRPPTSSLSRLGTDTPGSPSLATAQALGTRLPAYRQQCHDVDVAAIRGRSSTTSCTPTPSPGRGRQGPCDRRVGRAPAGSPCGVVMDHRLGGRAHRAPVRHDVDDVAVHRPPRRLHGRRPSGSSEYGMLTRSHSRHRH
jgi:hypothetical protein